MESLENFNQKPERGGKIVFWAVAIVAALIGAGIVAFLVTRPGTQQVQQQTMEGAFREGDPEFAALTKKIVIENDEDRTLESPTGLGSIQMNIAGKIRNLTGKTITGLELKVTVVDLADRPVKEKTDIIVPKRRDSIPSMEVVPVNIIMDGFKKEDNRANIDWKVTAIKVE